MDPSIVAFGGNVVMHDARASPQNPALYVIDSLAPFDTPFVALSYPPSPLNGRSDVRYFAWGSLLFAFGGAQITPCASAPCAPNVTYNDLFAMELAYNVGMAQPPVTDQGVGWVQVSPAATGAVPGYPGPRVGSSITPFHTHAFLFGGVSRTDPTADPNECIYGGNPNDPNSPPAPTDCFFHQHVHGFQPSGMTGQITSSAVFGPPVLPANSVPGTLWTQWASNGYGGNPAITGRADHTAGAMGNQFFVLGGVVAPGVRVSELWAYNLVTQTWGQVQSPGAAPGVGRAVAEVIGMHYYVLLQENFYPPSPNNPPAQPAQLWRWRPSLTFPPSGGGGAGYDAATARGHTAGIVIGILIGLGNLYVLILLAGNAGVALLPEALSSLLSGLPVVGACVGGGKPAVPGYYSSAPSGAGAASSGSAGYSAPPDL